MSLAELKKEVDTLAPDMLADLRAYVDRKDDAEWDAQIDRDFSPDGRLASVMEEVRKDLRAGRLADWP